MKTILQNIENMATCCGDHIAVADEKRELSYKKMLSESKKIGSNIVKTTNATNQAIAIYLDKSPELIETMLGVLYSNNFYTVLDIYTPLARIEKIFESLQPSVIITDLGKYQEISRYFSDIKIILIEECMTTAIDAEKLIDLRNSMSRSDPAYVLYTSGSTGTPKGVVVSHGALLSYIEWFTKTFSINSTTVFGSQTPLYFSMSVSDLYGSLSCGARYQIIPKKYFSFPLELIDYLNRWRVNAIYWVPSAMNIVGNWDTFRFCRLEYVRLILFAGEVMHVKLLNYWRKYCSQAKFYNLFGPTETTDICTFYPVEKEFPKTHTLPIGKACDNCKIYIFDGEMRPSTRGELYVGGPFLANGYYNNKDKTKEFFVQNPINKAYPEILYKTGDLVEVGEDGNLMYLGRKDYQIKRMGYRIELGEIEAKLGAIDGVMNCACIYNNEKGKITGFYQGKISEIKVRELLLEKLPAYMVPDEIICLKKMPYNKNGKINRKQLMNGEI